MGSEPNTDVKTALEIVEGAEQIFRKQPEKGHQHGLYTVVDDKECYCMVGAMTVSATSDKYKYNESYLQLHPNGHEAALAVLDNIPKPKIDKLGGVPNRKIQFDTLMIIEDFNDGVWNEEGRFATKEQCLNVLRGAKEQLRQNA